MIGSMLEVKDALEWMVTDPRWNEYVITSYCWQNNHCIHVFASTMRAIICDDGFRQQCKNFELMVGLILMALQVFDKRTPLMAKA
jgi:hypothetical protein